MGWHDRKNFHTIQLNIGDWLGGTSDMTTLEVGAYIRLLVKNYSNGLDGLPNDEKRLAAIAGLPNDKWKRVRDGVMRKFELIENRYHNPRTLREVAKIHPASAMLGKKTLPCKSPSFDDNPLNKKSLESQDEFNLPHNTNIPIYNIQYTNNNISSDSLNIDSKLVVCPESIPSEWAVQYLDCGWSTDRLDEVATDFVSRYRGQFKQDWQGQWHWFMGRASKSPVKGT